MKKILSFLLVLALGLVFVGCTNDPVKPTKVEIKGANEVEVGATIKLEVTVSPSDAEDKSVTWESSDKAIATVDGGTVKGVKEGTVTITATAKADTAVKGEFKITVKAKVETHTHAFGEWVTVKEATEAEEGLKERTCECGEKETETIAKLEHVHHFVDGKCECGEVEGHTHAFGEWVTVKEATETEEGLKERTCECGEKETETIAKLEHVHNFVDGKCACGEEEPTGLPTFLQITNQRAKYALGNELALGVVVYPVDAENQEVVWSVSDESIATIDESGILTPVAAGKVKVTVTSAATAEVTNSIEIEIVADEASADKVVEELTITSNKETYLLHDALNSNLSKTFVPADASVTTVYWESSDEEVVGIYATSRNPYIKGVGTATLTCYSAANPEVYFEIDVTINDYVTPTSFEVTNKSGAPVTSYTFEEKQTRQLVIAVEPADGDPRATYTSSDEAVATVDETGLIKGIVPGTATITVTSLANPEFVKTIEVTVTEHVDEIIEVQKVTVDGEKDMFMGYKLKLTAKVYPENVAQSVTWEVHSSSKNLATIDETGLVVALATGTFRVRAVSVLDPTVKSGYFSINIQNKPEPYPIGDMKGYEIIIMNADSALGDNDPFLESYKQSDKLAKQKAWSEVETTYNCKIKVVAYPAEAPWGQARINWIIDNATNGTSQCDLGVVSTNWIYQFANANAAVDVSEMYGKYGLSQMEPALKAAGSYKGKLYVASTGISSTATFVDLGLYYNYGWLKELGVENPAKMFNEGKWTYSNFKQWVLDTQAKLGENEYVLGGAPYYYWYGMTNAAGQVIANTESAKVYITTPKSIAATTLIWNLVEQGAVNTNITWAESNDVANSFWRNDGGGTLMTSGYLWFVRNSGRWTETMWGEGTTEFGYVPFPYPDDVNKEDTRIGISGLSAYMYIAGRSYPAELGTEGANKVWAVMNEMFLNTIKYQEEDPLFNAEEIIETSLKSRIDDPESIKAVMFYNAKRVFYDPAHALYGSTSATPLKAPANNAMFKGNDYMEEFNAVYETYETDFLKIYAAS